MGILDQNLQLGGEIIFNENGIIVYSPTVEKRETISKILQENSTINFEQKVELKAQLDIKIIRLLISELTNLKDEIEHISDDELTFKLSNGNKTIKNMLRQLKSILEDISTDIMYESLDQIDAICQVLNASTSINKLEKTLDKLGLSMEDIKLLSQGDKSVLEKVKNNKQTKSKKTVKPKEKANSKRTKKTVEVTSEE
jgi:hypothetical protein